MSEFTLTKENLSYPPERNYFITCAILAGLIWVLGFCLIPYALILAAIAWFANGLLVARLRSDSVQVSENQFPELYATYVDVAKKLGVTPLPELYILESGGVLNAFATRHSGRNFVVIYANFLDLVGPSSPEIRFIIGHEFGHIQKSHLLKRALLFPAVLVPMITEAYHRSNEATCDRYGAFAADNLEGATRGLLTLGAGREARHLQPHNFACQHFQHRGFFVSWYELISSYPTLSKRVVLLLATADEAFRVKAARDFLAYLFAFFINWRIVLVVYIASIVALQVLGTQVGKTLKEAQAKAANAEAPGATPEPVVPSGN